MNLISISKQKSIKAGVAWLIGGMILSGLFDFIKISLNSYQVANGLTFQKNSQRVISTQNNDKNQNWEKNKINDILYV